MQNTIIKQMQTTKNTKEKAVLRVLVSEFQRGNSKTISDDTAISIIRSMIKNSTIVLEKARNQEETDEAQFTISFLSSFLPVEEEVTDSFIIEWVKDNLDLINTKNRMGLMKPLKERFKSVDGNKLKHILQNI